MNPVLRGSLLVLFCVSLFASTSARAENVRVTVIDIAGGRAYLEPGSVRGIRRGAQVRFRRQNYEVVATTESYCVVELGTHTLALGARGTTRVRRGGDEPEPARRLPEPSPLSNFEGIWTGAEHPAASQNPDYVPLSGGAGSRRIRVDLRSSTTALLPFSDRPALLATQLRGRINAQLVQGMPLRLSADAALQIYFGAADRRAGSSRPILVARQLELSYGTDSSFYAAIGRLRRAASSVGTLDGARLQSPRFSGFQIAAFGGAVPQPHSGIPAFSAARFGLEFSYQDFESALRPSASLVARGSTFEGALDERRLDARVRLMPGTISLGVQAELALHDQDNPWNAPALELFTAGVDVTGHHGGFRWALRGDYRVPERSRWLASFLPPGYFCVSAPNPADPASQTCSQGSNARFLGAGDVEMRWSKFAVGLTGHYLNAPDNGTNQWLALAHLRMIDLLGFLRTSVSASVTRGSFMHVYSGRVGVGFALLRGKIDIGLSYRPSLRFYFADIVSAWDHRVGAQVFARLTPEWDVSFSGDGLFGRDVGALLLQLQIMWRPRIGAATP